jgi:hypothetical protein
MQLMEFSEPVYTGMTDFETCPFCRSPNHGKEHMEYPLYKPQCRSWQGMGAKRTGKLHGPWRVGCSDRSLERKKTLAGTCRREWGHFGDATHTRALGCKLSKGRGVPPPNHDKSMEYLFERLARAMESLSTCTPRHDQQIPSRQ